MKSIILAASSVLALTLVACGGGEATPPAKDPSQNSGTTGTTGAESAHKEGHNEHGHHGKHEDGKHDDHGNISPALKDFHHVIAPVWHSNAGKERTDKTCTDVKTLQEKAEATKDSELVAAVKEVDAACAKDGRADVEKKLSAVHDRFHVLSKAEKKD